LLTIINLHWLPFEEILQLSNQEVKKIVAF